MAKRKHAMPGGEIKKERRHLYLRDERSKSKLLVSKV